jgi:hypothetical protein
MRGRVGDWPLPIAPKKNTAAQIRRLARRPIASAIRPPIWDPMMAPKSSAVTTNVCSVWLR